MKITIAERLKPFSHVPGSASLLPGTCHVIEAFPALIRIGTIFELRLQVTGPVRDFTLEQDLEENCVWVFGRAAEGFYRFRLQRVLSGIEIVADKLPPEGIVFNGKRICPKEKLFVSTEELFFLPKVWERLSLGMHKSQDWDLVLRRFDLKEILPVLFGLGQKIPFQQLGPLSGMEKFLKIDKEDKQGMHASLESLCRAGFSKILVPRLIDDQHQGIFLETEEGGNPYLLLQELARLIRKLFFFQENHCLHLLPSVLFDAGRFIRIQVYRGSLDFPNSEENRIAEIDMEWASFRLRRVIIRPYVTEHIVLVLQKELHSFRIRTSSSERGRRHDASNPLCLEEGKTIYLDRFQA